MRQAVLASMPDLDSCVAEHRLTVTSGQGHRDFQYRVAAVPTPVPLFGGRGMTRGNDLYLRLEVFTQTGSEDYDIMGLTRQQVIHAQRMLERTDLGLDRIAEECGFGSAAVLRQNFARVLDTTPTAYRARFSCRDERMLEPVPA